MLPSPGEIEDKRFLMFALVSFSVELRASADVCLTVTLTFWQMQLLMSSPLPISCFVFLCMRHTFQQATATPGTVERLWSTECTSWRWLSKSCNDQEEPLHHLKNVVTSFNLQLTRWVLISRKTSLLRFKNSRDIVQSAQSCFQIQGWERTWVYSPFNCGCMLFQLLPWVLLLKAALIQTTKAVAMPLWTQIWTLPVISRPHMDTQVLATVIHNVRWWGHCGGGVGGGVGRRASSSFRVNSVFWGYDLLSF